MDKIGADFYRSVEMIGSRDRDGRDLTPTERAYRAHYAGRMRA